MQSKSIVCSCQTPMRCNSGKHVDVYLNKSINTAFAVCARTTRAMCNGGSN